MTMKKVILYVHGKDGSAFEAEHYKELCQDYEVIGLDYKGTTPWETKDEIKGVYDDLLNSFGSVSIIANSIGAYFCMNALQEENIPQALFISPIVDMEKLIVDMMAWANVTESELKAKQEIDTNFGEKLSWEYLHYVREHPIKIWTSPTWILYGDRDNLTNLATIQNFANKHNAALTIMKSGEHWFHTDDQMKFLDNWVKSSLL